MSSIDRIGTSATRRLLFVLFLLCFLVSLRPLAAQSVPIGSTTAVGSSSSATTVSISLPLGGTIGAVKMFGQGSPNVDFVNAGGTCVPNATFLAGQSCTVSVVFSPASPGVRPGAIVLLDGSNHVLATQLLTGAATGAVGVFVPGLINTVAGDASWVYTGDGNPATNSPLFLPFGIAVNATGDLFIADSSNNRIRKVLASTGIISTIAGTGTPGSTGDNGPAVAATVNAPSSLALDPAGNLYFSDSANNAIRRIDAFTGIITTVAGTIGTQGDTGDNGPATSALLNTPNGISFDANGNLYIADTGNNVIRMVNTSGTITRVAGTGTAGYSGDGSLAINATISGPWGVTAASSGGFYIADQRNGRIRLVNAAGTITTIAGTTPGYSGDSGPATSAQLFEPASVLIDVAGNLYIADSGNNRVRRVAPGTGIITTYAGSGQETFNGDGGPANIAGLYGPYAFALDTQGSLYIADVFHNRIRKVSANSAILDFPVMRVNRVSSPMPQSIENDGNAALDFTKFNPVSNSQLDPNTTTCSTTIPLAIDVQCVIGVDFAPTTTGNLITGELDADSNAGNSPAAITLTGQVLDVDPAAATLTSSANPSTTGSPVIFTVSVTSTGTTPTGAITLLDGTTTIGTATLGSGGVGSFTISSLTSGSHSLTASYAGDSQNASAVSPVLIQVVKDQQAATTTSLTSASSTTPAGAPVTFTATVNIVTANSGNGVITGNVSFKQGANTLGVGTINNATATASTGTATIQLSNLPVGTDSIVAVYAGNTNYLGSSSSPYVETVQLATSKVVVTTAANPSLAGAPLALTATLTSNGGIPTGSVNFLDGSVSLGSAPVNAQGVAILSVPGKFWTVGNHALTAVYAGDQNDSGSTSPAVGELINIAPSTTSITSSLNPAGLGASVTFTARVTTQAGTPTGTVQFFDGSASIGSGPLTATGVSTAVGTFATTSLAVGPHSITAVYSGDASDATSSSTGYTETIQTATIADSLTSSANPSIFGAPLTLTARVSGSGSTPTGTVTLLDSGAAIATLPVPANGVVAFSDPSLSIGAHVLTAAYSGDTNHAATSSPALTENILQATTTALTSSTNSIVAGKSVTLTASVIGVSGKPLTGTVKFTDGATLLTTVAVDANGNATFTTPGLTPGTHNILATYSGDTLDAVSSSKTIVVTITIATTSTTFSTSANPINSGSTLTLSSTVTGNGGTSTGTVTFHDGGTVIASVQLTAAGTASFSLSTLTPGIHQLSASYSGDTLDSTSTSPTISQKIAQVTTVTLASATNPSLLQDNVVLNLSVSNGAPSAPPTGSVTLTDGGVTLATLLLSPTGTATYTLQAPTLGAHTLVVNYAGDNDNSPAASQPLIQNVTLRPSAISFDPSATHISSGQQITLISVVQASGSRPATGSVTFVSGSTVLGTATIDATGLASVTVIPPQGSFNTVAKYSGDTLYAASTSPSISIIVGPTIEFTIGLTPGSISMASGDHGSLNINVASASTFADVLNLGCAGLPTDATCTFSKPSITVANGVAQSLSVEVDTGNPLGSGATASNTQPNSISNTEACALPAGALLAILLFFNRRRLHKINPKLALFTLLLLLGGGATLLTGCGTSLNVNHTVAGSYTFQIIATGQKTGVTQTANVHLTVTQ